VCVGPDSHVRVFDARSGQAPTYAPQERAAVMAEVDLSLTCLVADQEKFGLVSLTAW